MHHAFYESFANLDCENRIERRAEMKMPIAKTLTKRYSLGSGIAVA